MFWLFSCCLGPLSRHGNSAPWAYIVVSLQQCSFFLTLRGNFGADSNNFGPCPSHAFCLTELQSLTDLLLFSVLIGAPSILIMVTNLHRFDPIPWRATPLQKRLAALQLVVLFSFCRLSRRQWRESKSNLNLFLLSSPVFWRLSVSGVNPSQTGPWPASSAVTSRSARLQAGTSPESVA